MGGNRSRRNDVGESLGMIREIPKEIGMFKVMTGMDALRTTPPATEMIIETILPKQFNTIIAGTTGCKKSYWTMQMAMSIANNEPCFCGWKIQKKGLSVLYVDTEVGMDEMHRRVQNIARNMDFDCGNRFNYVSKHGTHADIWKDTHEAIRIFNPDMLVIDSLYNSSVEREIEKGYKVAKLTDQLTLFKQKYGITLVVVHHFVKGNHEKGLIIDRMSGANPLQNWVEHQILMTKTNELNLNLIRIVKSRGIDYSDQHYGLTWDASMTHFSMSGIIHNWQAFLADEAKKKRWMDALDRLPEEFDTNRWLNVTVNEKQCCERTAKTWLKELTRTEMIEKISHGNYKKKLKIVDNEIE